MSKVRDREWQPHKGHYRVPYYRAGGHDLDCTTKIFDINDFDGSVQLKRNKMLEGLCQNTLTIQNFGFYLKKGIKIIKFSYSSIWFGGSHISIILQVASS